jgi:hypothetical protein
MHERNIAIAGAVLLAGYFAFRKKPEPVGSATFEPLSYPMGTSPYPNESPSALPPALPAGLPPYPPGGWFGDAPKDIPDTSGLPAAWISINRAPTTVLVAEDPYS